MASHILSLGISSILATTAIPAIVSLRLARDGKVMRVPPRKLKSDSTLELTRRPVPCRECRGAGMLPCQVCQAVGKLSRGGFSRNNTVRLQNIVGSKWTSVTAINGKWRHFVCIDKSGTSIKNAVITLAGTCGPAAKRIRIDVPVKELKSRSHWQGGWTTLHHIEDESETLKTCSACRGEASVLCPGCEGLGQTGF